LPEVPDIHVSIVVPVYNEAESLVRLAAEVRAAMAGTPWTRELIFVDDASTDGSLEILRRIAVEDPTVRVLAHRRNAGQSAALIAGFRAARGAFVVTLDADLQNDPADIPRLVDELGACDVVSGVREARRDGWLRRLSGRVANRARRLVTGDSVTDIGCALKAYRTGYLRRVPAFVGVHRFLPALIELDGGRLREVPVRHRPRAHGASKYNVRNRLWRGITDLLAVRWMQARRIDPDNARELEVRSEPAGTGAVEPAAR
jgi:glycosyltransferase involved in cell wall biosynthesis